MRYRALRGTEAGFVKLIDVAARLNCDLKGNGDAEIIGVVGIDEAESGHLTFVSNPKYAAKARTTKASAVIVSPDFPEIETATLRSSNPYLAFAHAVELFYHPPNPMHAIDAAARIASSATIGEGASIAPYVVIEEDVQIGKNCTLYPFVHISEGARIGDNFKAYAH